MRALALLLVVAACSSPGAPKSTSHLPGAAGLRGVADFSNIDSAEERAVALFGEVHKVLSHPRCVNCHPAGDSPLQRGGLRHQPLAVRGDEGRGAPGMNCGTCHRESNYQGLPGAPDWHIAPRSMTWEGLSAGAICEQIKDTRRNGGKSLDELHEHLARDPLVAYGFKPPPHLEPAPGSQALLGELVRAWIDAGAQCPAP